MLEEEPGASMFVIGPAVHKVETPRWSDHGLLTDSELLLCARHESKNCLDKTH